MKATLEERLTPELELISRWVAYQIGRNGRGEPCPDPLFKESREMLQANGIYVGYNGERNTIEMRRLRASDVATDTTSDD